MEVKAVTFHTYRTIFLQDELLLFAIPRILRDFIQRHSLPSKAAMTFMVSTMIFILVFPAFASAMTGYSPKATAFVPNDVGIYVPFNKFSIVLYIIHDGKRVNEADDFIVVGLPYDDANTGK